MTQPEALQEWERHEISRISALVLGRSAQYGFKLCENPDAADLVVLLDSCSFKTQRDVAGYRRLPYLRDPFRLCCINYEDGPPGFLPGLYSSLERFRFDSSFHLSWPHLRFPNELIDVVDASSQTFSPDLLFSFSGSCSHPLRRRLFDSVRLDARCQIREIRKWYNHDDSEKRGYVDEILRSKFVLCPRGIASYSHRIIETLALGRVPVVIADDWVPFSVEEVDYFVRIPESALEHLPSLLAELEPEYERHRAAAMRVYAKYFARDIRYAVAIGKLCEFYLTHRDGINFGVLDRRWRSRAFYRRNGWLLRQRLRRRVGRIGTQMLSRLRG